MYAYNPRKKSSAELSQSLVGADRWDILSGILSELALKKGESPKQHWMLVGARGMGKSHLLTLLYHKVRADKKLCKIWIPVLFPEEIRMAGDLAKFLERAISEVQRDLEKEKSPVASVLQEKIVRIRSVRPDERADYLFSLMTWVRREIGRHILLITENLQQLLGKKISLIDQKKLRAFLQSEDALLLIGSATTVFTALHDHSHPFYHFFHIRRLQELSFEDIKTLVGNLLSGHDKQERARIMTENEARLRVIHSFTGGNPRMAVFLSDILKTDINEEMIQIMDRILDELTPYFEAIINETPEYLHDIINVLAVFEPAQSPKEIAEHLEMEQGTVRNYLKQAKESGYVRVAFSKGKSNYYCLNEYLYRAWFQMRDSSHREEMRWLMELMMFLYSREHISAEKERIEQLELKEGNNYHQLVRQTYDFMVTNPTFCSIIDLCEQQTNINIKSNVNIENKLRKLVKGRLKELNNNKKLSKREYMKKVSQILIDFASGLDNPAVSLLSHSLSMAMYFKNTFDISSSFKIYKNDILKLQINYNNYIKEKINIDKEYKEFSDSDFFVIIASENYDIALLKIEENIIFSEKIIVILLLSFLEIQMVYHANCNDYCKMIKCYDLFYKICAKFNYESKEFGLYIVLIMSNYIGIVSDKTINEFINYASKKSEISLFFTIIMPCIKDPKSELAQKTMSDPPVADIVRKINNLLAYNLEQEKNEILEATISAAEID